MSGLGQRLAANTLHAASGRFAALAVWVVFTPPILRSLGAGGFGIWSLFFALTGYFAALDFGLVQGTLRHVAAARELGHDVATGQFATLGVLGYLALGSLWLVLAVSLQNQVIAWLRIPPQLDAEARFALMAGAGVFVLAGGANITMAVAQGHGRFDLANRVILAIAAEQAAGFAVVLHQGWGLRGLVLNVGLGWALGCVAGVVLLRRALPTFRWAWPHASLVRTPDAIRFGGPVQATSMLAVVHQQVDKVLLSRFVALSAVTPYELGSRVATATASLPQLMLLAVMPEVAAIHAAGDHVRLREIYDRGSRYALTLLAIVFAATFASASRFYGVWLGPGHEQAALALRALTVAGGISLATGFGTTLARGVGRTDLEAWFAALTVAVHLALSLWLMPRIGFSGALIATVVSAFIGSALFMVLLARALRWPLFGVVLRPCAVPLLAILMGVGAGMGVDRALPAAMGAEAWVWLGVVGTVAAAVALGASTMTGYFPWREAQSLLTARWRGRPTGVGGS